MDDQGSGRGARGALLRVVLPLVVLVGVGIGLWLGLARGPAARARNVILISIDTCRADRLGCYGFERDTTPQLDALARRGVLFERASSTAPITLPAHTSLLTGTLPPHHGVHDNNYLLDEGVVTLAQQLRDAGWRTAAFVSAFVLDSRFGLGRGFEQYDDVLGGAREDVADPWFINERRGEATSRAALRWLEREHDQPFFLFLHYFDPHARYDPPEPFATQYADDPYAGEMAYVDHCIGRVLERLDELGRFDDTLVVLTADHAESLGEHGERTHAYFAYQSTIRIPLIVAAPGARRGARVAEPVSVVDVAPTILALLGVERAPVQVGQDLSPHLFGAPAPRERDLYCESLYPTKFGCAALRSLMRGRWKYVWSVEPELYDLQDDPEESRNRIEHEPEVAAELHARLMRLLDEQRSPARSGAAAPSDDDSLERIKALGYAGGTVDPSLEADPDAQDAKDFLPTYNRFLKVYLLLAEGRHEEAAETCREVLAVRPGLLEALEILGGIAGEQGRHADAIERYREFLAQAEEQRARDAPQGRHPLDLGIGKVLVALGDAQRALGQHPAALESYQRAAQATPESPDPLIGVADLLAQDLARFGQAIHTYRAALELDPGSVVVLNNLANCFFAQQRLDEAARHYELALESDPDHAEAWHNLGSVRLAQGRPADALAPLEQACRLEPAGVPARVKLGRALSGLERWAEARARFEEALEREPSDDEAAFGLGLCLLQQGQLEQARGVWGAHARLGVAQLRFLDERAWALAADPDAPAHRPTAALRLAELLAQVSEARDARVLDTLAVAQAATGDFEAAARSVQRALDLVDADDEALAEGLRRRLDLFRSSRPLRAAGARPGHP